MVRSIFLVLSDATGPDTDAEFNRWYSEKHIQDVSKVPGVVSATRYRIEKGVTVLPGVNADSHGFVARLKRKQLKSWKSLPQTCARALIPALWISARRLISRVSPAASASRSRTASPQSNKHD